MEIHPLAMPGKEVDPNDPFWKVDPKAVQEARLNVLSQLVEISENEQQGYEYLHGGPFFGRLAIDRIRLEQAQRSISATESTDQDNQGEQ